MSVVELDQPRFFVTQTTKHLNKAQNLKFSDRIRTRFEEAYLTKSQYKPEGTLDEKGFSPILVQKQLDFAQSEVDLAEFQKMHADWAEDHNKKLQKFHSKQEKFAKNHFHTHKRCHVMLDEMAVLQKEAKREHDLAVMFENELHEMAEEEKELLTRLELLDDELERLRPASDFIEECAQESCLFENPEKILQRYERIASDIEKKKYQQARITGIDNLKLLIIKKNHHIRMLSNIIKSTSKNNVYEKLENIKLTERSINKNSEHSRILSSIKSICDYVFTTQSIVGKVQGYTSTPSDIGQQLSIIQQRFLEMTYILAQHDFESSTREFQKNKILYGSPSRFASQDLRSQSISRRASAKKIFPESDSASVNSKSSLGSQRRTHSFQVGEKKIISVPESEKLKTSQSRKKSVQKVLKF